MGGEIAQAFRRSVALVCGVDQYGPGLPSLRTAVADARAIGSALAAHGFEDTILLDGEVTRERLRGFLTDRAADLTEDDRLVVYFAGHGLSAPSDRGPEGFLLLSDAVSADPTSYFAMAALRRLLEPLRCRHMLLFLDCCFAGTFQWAARRDVESQLMPIYQQTLARYTSRPAWQVLVSAGHDEAASDGVAATDGPWLQTLRVETAQHSPFAAALLQGLSGEADYTDDGLIVASELEVYIRSYVERLTQTRQTPQLYKLERHDRGEFVFQVPGREFRLGDAPALRPENCPYRGAQPFTAEDHPLFFGRRAATQQLIERVRTQPFTAVLGPSGSGKSSLLQAGLVPHLQREPSTTVVVAHAGADPIASFCGAIPLGNGPSARLSGLLDRLDAWMASNPNDRLVIVVDDAEQLVLAPERARHTFLRDLARAFDRYATRLRAVFALRSDHEPAFTQSPLCNHWRRGRFEVPPPTQDELREMIRLPARHHELSFEPPSLIDTLINVVYTMPGGLAALSASLHALYVRVIERDEDRLISSADYDAVGGVNGVLARRASATWRALTDVNPAYKMTGQRILLRMTAMRNGELVRRRVDPSDLVSGDPSEDERGAVLLRTLERDHLMVRDQDGWALAHDALAHIWPELCASHGRCADLVQQVPTLVTAILAVSQATRVWAARAKQPANLWHDDTRLHHVQRLIRQFEGYFSALEREFIRCSVAQTRRRLRWKFVLAFAALAFCVGGTVGWDRYVRTFDDDYVDYVRRWGAPLGIHPISAAEASHRVEAVRLTRKGRVGRIERAEVVRYGKRCARDHHLAGYQPELEIMSGTAGGAQQPCRWEFSYDPESGTVTQEKAEGRDGGLLYTLVYRSTKDRAKVIAEYWGEVGCSLRSGHGDAELVEFHRNEQGLDEEKVYLANGGRTPAVSDRAIHIEQTLYDSGYNVAKTLHLDRSRHPTRDRDGVAGWHATYDARGNKLEQTYVDETGGIANNRSGIARYELTYDLFGNPAAQRWFDNQGAPVRDGSGAAGWQMTYDAEPDRSERASFDEHGAPTPDITGVARRRTSYDDRGNPVRVRNLDPAGQCVLDKDGVAGWNMTYDARDNLIERVTVDAADRPAPDHEGIACRRWSYDEQGNQTRATALDASCLRAVPRQGIASVGMSYDQRGNKTAIEHLDAAGRRTPDKDGIASIQISYDARDNIVELRYLDEADRPVRNADQVAQVQRLYDSLGNLIEERYLDEEGRATPNRAGVSAVRMTYDTQGNEAQTQKSNLDASGRPTRDTSGISITRMSYDKLGNRIHTSYFDEAGHPTRSGEGVAGFQTRYDARGNELEISYVDELDRPVRSKDGYARKRFVYDAHGNPTDELYRDEDDHPAHDRAGVSRRHRVFDARGRQTELTYFDEAGSPMRNQDGAAVERVTYDPHGNQVRLEDLDPSGHAIRGVTGVAGWRASYDARGNLIERVFLDGDGNPAADGNDVAIVRSSHDSADRETTRTTYNVAGMPVRDGDGVVTTRTSYDSRGLAIAVSYYDEAEQPVALRHDAHVASKQMSYDRRGNHIETRYFDVTGSSPPADLHVASMQLAYDARDREVTRRYLDAAGKAARNEDGVATRRMSYDIYGHPTEITSFDVRDRPVRAGDGIASRRMAYDDYGNITDTTYLDEAGKHVRAKDGTASWRAAYDEHGHVIRWTNFGLQGEPVRDVNGICRWTASYDRQGHEIERVYRDEQRQIMSLRDGTAIVRRTYTPDGRLAQTVRLDTRGRVLATKDEPAP